MNVRSKLLATGLPLIVVPVLASLAIVWSILATHTLQERARFLDSQVGLVQGRLVWDYELLSRAGLQEDTFYRQNVVDRMSGSLNRLVGSDAVVLILNHQHQVVLGPEGWAGKVLPAADPFEVVYTKTSGRIEAPSSLDPQAGKWLVSWDRFVAWNWTIIAMVPVFQIQSAVISAVAVSLAATLLLLAIGVVVFVVVSRVITRPLIALQSLAVDMGQGHLDRRASVHGDDEVAQLAQHWNQMADRLEELTRGLEDRVAERSRELEETLEASQALQVQMLQSEKMAALGELVAGVAHELNSPLAAISSAGGILKTTFSDTVFTTLSQWSALAPAQQALVRELLGRGMAAGFLGSSAMRSPLRDDLVATLAAAGAADPRGLSATLIEAGVTRVEAHEAALLAAEGGEVVAQVAANLFAAQFSAQIVESGVERAVKVIQALRDYSRFDTARQSSCVSIEESIDTVLTLLHSRLRNGVEVVRSFAPGSRVMADPDRLGQLWINLMGNAIHAMGGTGTLELRTELVGKGLLVQIIDSGPGIPEALQEKIFKPYFTTKKRGEGTGLGLMICRTIVEECGGTLSFRSVPGRTIFEAQFPERC